LAPYPGYSGSLKVAGALSVSYTSPGTQAFAWELTGVDPDCKDGPGDLPNSCGVHVHVGTDCSDKDTIGGHFYNQIEYPDSDPWQAVSYYSHAVDGINYAFSSNNYVSTGYLYVDLYAHTMVVHDFTGARVACGIVGETPPDYAVASFSKYPGYTGDLDVDGSMIVSFKRSGTQGLFWDLSGADPDCKKGAKDGVPNSCGIHIHVGTDCSDASTVGGHYWNKVQFSEYDPWQSVEYKSSAKNGKTKSQEVVPVTTGLKWTDVAGHVMIVHDAKGGRIACGTINTPYKTSGLAPYPGYPGDEMVTGEIVVYDASKGAQIIAWALTVENSDCQGGAVEGVPNSCGIHIHQGTDCSDKDTIGGHYYSSSLGKDPWGIISYSTKDGSTAATGELTTGLSWADIDGHVMVVHDATGARISCGKLGV
jgi:predicted DNA-binding protein with PD1-like motif